MQDIVTSLKVQCEYMIIYNTLSHMKILGENMMYIETQNHDKIDCLIYNFS